MKFFQNIWPEYQGDTRFTKWGRIAKDESSKRGQLLFSVATGLHGRLGWAAKDLKFVKIKINFLSGCDFSVPAEAEGSETTAADKKLAPGQEAREELGKRRS